MSGHYLIYIRRSYKEASAADVSDETQEAVARSLLPKDATCEVISDSGGHNSGATDDREGYRRLIARVREGGIAGIAVYDLSRLARNVRLMVNLKDELERQQVAILAGNLPTTKTDSAVGRFMFNMLVSAAQFQRDLTSEQMKTQAERTFLRGGHRGNDPLGYRTARDADGTVCKPRRLVVVPEEAAVVRRVFHLLRDMPFSEIAALLNSEGVRRRSSSPWTVDAVKDIWRRREVYRGNVVTKRGLVICTPAEAEVVAFHEPILSEQEVRDATAGVDARVRHRARKPRNAKRLYALRGTVFCECGARMRGDARMNRGKTWRYYACPAAEGRSTLRDADGNLVACDAHRVVALDAERVVVDAMLEAVLPAEAIDRANEELRRRLAAPAPGTSDKTRERLRGRLGRLADLYAWGDLSEADYRKQKAEVEGALAALPGESDKVVLFDRHRRVVGSLADTLADATPEAVQEFVALLVERVEIRDRQVVRVEWAAPARPFFASEAWVRDCAGLARPEGFEPPTV